jgi:carboxyl-terminal processing protease
MRRNITFLLGTVTGACLTFLVAGPQGAHLVAAAKAAARSDSTYSQLNLFGDVFERVRASYVEKPDDSKLMEGAINGMISSLDPHSRYMNAKGWSDMQASSAGSASKSRWKTASSRWWRRSTIRPRPRQASCRAM